MMQLLIVALWMLVLAGGFWGVWIGIRKDPRQALLLLLIFGAAYLLRGGSTADQFVGLEYEDAYIYAAASRLSTADDAGQSFIDGVIVCSIGSLDNCTATESFPGHLLGFPVLLKAVEDVVGYRPSLAATVGALVSSIAALMVWWAAWAIFRSRVAAAISGFLFCVTPVLALYGGSATSESVSSLPMAVAIGAAAMTRRSEFSRSWLGWHFLVIVAVAVAAMVRRENGIFIGILPFILLLQPPAYISNRTRWFTSLAWISVAAVAAQPVVSSVVSEVGEFGGFSFGLGRLLETAPAMVRALVSPEWFGLSAILAALGTFRILVRARQPKSEVDAALLLAVAVIAAGMVVLYMAHVRSQYQLMGVAIDPFDFLRYLSNIGIFLCLLVPAAVHIDRSEEFSPALRRLALAGAAGYLLLNSISTIKLREHMVETEQHVRILPALAAIKEARELGNRYPIVTLEPLLIQLYGEADIQVIALPLLTPELVDQVGGRILYLRQDHYQNEVNGKRYAKGLAALPTFGADELRHGKGWTVIALGEPVEESSVSPR